MSLPVLPLLVALLACAPETPQEASTNEPAAPPTEVNAGVVSATDGVPIVYDARGAGETALVFVHCWSCDREFWREQFDVFAESYRVVRMDLPGHGESGAKRDSWSIAGLAEDVRMVVDELGLERVILVGHSMGGPISLLAAPLLGERVVGIACVDTLHDVAMKWDKEMAAPVIAAYERDFEGTNAQFIPMMFPEGADPGLVEWVTTRANSTNRTAASALMADFPNLDQAAFMQAARVPIRCVNAAPFGQLIPATAIEANREFGDFDATLVENVGHYLLLERPDEFNEKLAAAIAGLAGE
jgi:pimeloyl-ACP methyl ester carboxylesterase